MQSLDRDEVGIHVDAPPEEVYALIADVTGPAVGARFEAVNTNAGKTWKNRPVVRVADPGREFAFARTERFVGTLAWRYRFEPEDGGTRVIESYEVERPISRFGWFVLERVFKAGDIGAGLRAGMQTTLERLRATAEHRTPAA